MKEKKKILLASFVTALLVTLVLSLTSCFTSLATPEVDPQPKEVIVENINRAEENNTRSFEHFADFLIEWGFPQFNRSKVIWAEDLFVLHYCLDGGISSEKDAVLPRAIEIARRFIDDRYDHININNPAAVTDAIIDTLVEYSGDPYAIYRVAEKADEHTDNMSGKFGGIGVVVEYDDENETVMITEVVIGSPAEAAGLKVGDIFYSIDGNLISDIGHRNAINYVRGEVGTQVTVEVLREDKSLSFTVTRQLVEVRSVGYGINEDNLGYIQISSFNSNTSEQFVVAVDHLSELGVKGLILDVRYNFGGYVQEAVDMLSYLLPTGLPTITYDYKTNPNVIKYTSDDTNSAGKVLDSVIDLPIVLLCNEYSASASEIFASVLIDYGKAGLIDLVSVGTTTYKKGIIQSSATYTDDKSTVTLTSAYYYPPSGKLIHGVGITPDIVIENTEDEDLQLLRAIDELSALCEKRKANMQESVRAAEESGVATLGCLADYLISWGFPRFNADKVLWVESLFVENYALNGGISGEPDEIFSRAIEVAKLFLSEYYDQINLSSSTAVTDGIINAFIECCDDPYAVYRSYEAADDFTEDMMGKFGGIGVVVQYDDEDMTVMISEVVLGSPAEAAGLKVGDYFYSVDGLLVSDIGHRNAVNYVRGEIGTTVTLVVLRGGELISFDVERALIEERTVGYGITDDNFGDIQISSFKKNTDEQFIAAVDTLLKMGVKGFIIDLRNNLGGYVETALNMLSYILPSDMHLISYDYKNKPDYILYSTTDTNSAGETLDFVLDMPIVILCNEYSASASEIFISVLRDYDRLGTVNITTVGQSTYKKGVIQQTGTYTDGATLTLTTVYYYPPSGELIHGVGITPDVVVDNTEDEDLQFLRAIEELKALSESANP